jgi:AraC-like DNA-binding protein
VTSAVFDIADFPAADRLEVLSGLMQTIPVPVEVKAPSLARMTIRCSGAVFGRVTLITCAGAGATVHRDASFPQHESIPRLVVSVVAAGGSQLEQDGRQTRLRAGDIVMYSSTMPYKATFNGVAKHSFMLDYGDIGLPQSVMHAQLATRISPDHPLAPAVVSYLTQLAQTADQMSPAHLAAVERPTIDLLRALLTTSAGDEFRSRDPLARTLGVRIVEYMREHLGNQDLTAASVAAAHSISQRYVYVILGRLGISFGDWIREQRLAGAAKTLSNPALELVNVSAIAYQWGFADHAQFSRAFRSAYGISPTQWRNSNATTRRP